MLASLVIICAAVTIVGGASLLGGSNPPCMACDGHPGPDGTWVSLTDSERDACLAKCRTTSDGIAWIIGGLVLVGAGVLLAVQPRVRRETDRSRP